MEVLSAGNVIKTIQFKAAIQLLLFFALVQLHRGEVHYPPHISVVQNNIVNDYICSPMPASIPAQWQRVHPTRATAYYYCYDFYVTQKNVSRCLHTITYASYHRTPLLDVTEYRYRCVIRLARFVLQLPTVVPNISNASVAVIGRRVTCCVPGSL